MARSFGADKMLACQISSISPDPPHQSHGAASRASLAAVSFSDSGYRSLMPVTPGSVIGTSAARQCLKRTGARGLRSASLRLGHHSAEA